MPIVQKCLCPHLLETGDRLIVVDDLFRLRRGGNVPSVEKGLTMQIQLLGKAAEIVEEQVAPGFYGSATEFISDIVLRADEFNRLKLERLCREVNIGLEEIKRGEVVEFDLEDILNKDAT